MSTIFPKLYDFFMKPLEKGTFRTIRQELLENAEGKVLELGSGTGINFSLYRDVHSVTAIEPNPSMTERAVHNRSKATIPIEIVQSNAEKLPFADNTFDTVVATLVFCTIPNVTEAIHEMKRVCKPNGKIVMFEHVRMRNAFLAKLQNVLTPVWKRVCDGCCLNRDTVTTITQSGFLLVEKKEYYKGLFVSMVIKNRKEEDVTYDK
ncbi:class I SAM-dependent methyltransferase [Ferdinandcohnia sp. Marseille-Q9671]